MVRQILISAQDIIPGNVIYGHVNAKPVLVIGVTQGMLSTSPFINLFVLTGAGEIHPWLGIHPNCRYTTLLDAN